MAASPNVLDLFHPAVADWFRQSFDGPTPPQTQGWPAIAGGRSTLILAPTGSGKTLTAFLWCINRLMFGEYRRARPALPRALYLAAQGAGRGYRTQPASSARRDCQSRQRARRRISSAGYRRTHRRYPGDRARAIPARSIRHPDHDAGVALPAADFECARGAACSRYRDHRRDPCARPDQARRAHGDVARTARSDSTCGRGALAAHWTVGDAASARRGRALSRRHGVSIAPARRTAVSRCRHRRYVGEEAARSENRSSGRGHGEDWPAGGDTERPRVARDRYARRSGPRSIRDSST